MRGDYPSDTNNSNAVSYELLFPTSHSQRPTSLANPAKPVSPVNPIYPELSVSHTNPINTHHYDYSPGNTKS